MSRHAGLYCVNGAKCSQSECTEQLQRCRHDESFIQFWKKGTHVNFDEYKALQSKLDSANKVIEQQKADVARYQFLKDECIQYKSAGYDGCDYGRYDLLWPHHNADLDAVLDTAINQSEATK